MAVREVVRPDGIVEYRVGGRLHRDDGPAVLLPSGQRKWYQHGVIQRERLANGELRFYRNGKLHRTDGPAIDGPIQQCWFLDGREHREAGPAQLLKSTGVLVWWRQGKIHRDNGPAVTHPDGRALWYRYGQLHRVGKAAALAPDGSHDWYSYGMLHRDDGPAMERPNGHTVWLRQGRIQRSDGPAILMPDGRAFFTKAGFVLGEDGKPLESAKVLKLLPQPVAIFTSVSIGSIEGKAFKLPPRAPFIAARNLVLEAQPASPAPRAPESNRRKRAP